VTTAPDVLLRLNAALDLLSAALESGDAGEVLAAEQPLASAVHALTAVDRSLVTPSPALGRLLLETRLAVERCRSLGESSSDLLSIVTRQATYGPRGRRVPARPAATVEALT